MQGSLVWGAGSVTAAAETAVAVGVAMGSEEGVGGSELAAAAVGEATSPVEAVESTCSSATRVVTWQTPSPTGHPGLGFLNLNPVVAVDSVQHPTPLGHPPTEGTAGERSAGWL